MYRHGAISVEEIESVIGHIKIHTQSEHAPEAPGMLLKHYAPRTKIILSDTIHEQIKQAYNQKIGLLVLQHKADIDPLIPQEVLSTTGDISEAAANLYAGLHRLDTLQLDLIIAEKFPDYGLGKTINDRLERATK